MNMLNFLKDDRLAHQIADFFADHSTGTIVAILLISALLLLPTFLLRPTEQASLEPGGPVFDLRERTNELFPARVHIASFIVEDRDGDILRQAPLWELYQNEQALRDSDLDAILYRGYDVDAQRHLQGVYTVADAVDGILRAGSANAVSLETATDGQVKKAISRGLEGPNGEFLRESFSKDASLEAAAIDGEEMEVWKAAALTIFVAADNTQLGGGAQTIAISNDPAAIEKERLNRRIMETLRGAEENYLIWGLALDVNLTSREQGRTAFPYIAATVILVLIVVGITLRSLKSVGLGFLGLLILLVWLKGFSNLIGLKSSLVIDLIVPIAMISLGADFLIHAVARYNEERVNFRWASQSLRVGMAGVLGALALASLSDSIAFLANVTSGIESIIGFGIAAGIAVFSSFVIMGILIPLVIMRLDQRKESKTGTSPSVQIPPEATPHTSWRARVGVGPVIVSLSRVPWLVLPLVAVATAFTTYVAFQLEPRFDTKDFFDAESDFVVGIDKLDEYIAPSLSGEPATIYVRGDLTEPDSLRGLKDLLNRFGENPNLGQGQDGEVFLYGRTVFDLLGRVAGSPLARQAVLDTTGVNITDLDLDGIPDSAEQTRAVYDYILAHGVPLDEETLAYDSAQVGQVLTKEGDEQSTAIVLGIQGARELVNLVEARESLERDLAPLEALPSISEVGITGSPFTREATLVATTRALTISLPVAAVACFLLLALWMRSFSFALVTTIPIGLVVSWLYAFMYLTGYSLNFVTATIAAVSIGVGIDFSIHMTQRFRQELPRHTDPPAALRTAAAGTGSALAGSAASSIVGFAVLGFAPMPLFSSYGIISAVMVLMAGIASLLVLPSLLLIVARLRGDGNKAS